MSAPLYGVWEASMGFASMRGFLDCERRATELRLHLEPLLFINSLCQHIFQRSYRIPRKRVLLLLKLVASNAATYPNPSSRKGKHDMSTNAMPGNMPRISWIPFKDDL